MTDRALEAEVDAMVRTIEDPEEAELLATLFELASRTAPDTDTDAHDNYTPFVYPH